ncbi:MAG TPA: aspartate aminotransferase family protein [Micromonosporaceae bacterium]|nr:aspartate aminotransferase family protein [Micromonosporaceae bacterium]
MDTPLSTAGTAPDPAEARERDRRHVWHTWSPVTADRAELMLSHGSNYRVWDVDGREYIDGSSLNSTCGYGHPKVAAAIADQSRLLQHFDISGGGHEPLGLLAERLASYMPERLAKTVFVNSGSEGIEAAMLIASSYWEHVGKPRSRVVAFRLGYHGSTLISRSLSGLPRCRHPFAAPFPITLVDLPLPPRDLRQPDSLPLLVAEFTRAFGDDANDWPVAVVVEPFLNVGGGVVLPRGFLRALRDLCDETGTLLVLDEIFTGYGRTGRMFACEHEDVVPDILVASKGLSGGYIPIAAVTVQQHIHDSFQHEAVLGGLRYGHTTSGHATACAAALATLDILDSENLVKRAELHGARLLDRFASWAGIGEVIDVRAYGLILVLEMSSTEAANDLITCARANGLLLRRQGARGEAIMVVPPLTIDDEGVNEIITRLDRSLAC